MEKILDKSTFTDDAKVMSKGQVTIPKDVREVLGVGNGDRVTFVVDHGKVKLGLESEQDVNNLMKSIRDED